MSEERYKLPVAVFLILVKKGQVLLMRRQNTRWYDGSYDMASGHMEKEEPLVDAVCREAKEELGITVAPQDAKFVSVFHSFFPEDGKEYMYFSFEVTRWQGEPKIGEPDKCDDIRWFSLEALPEKITPGTRDLLKAYKANTTFAESGF